MRPCHVISTERFVEDAFEVFMLDPDSGVVIAIQTSLLRIVAPTSIEPGDGVKRIALSRYSRRHFKPRAICDNDRFSGKS